MATSSILTNIKITDPQKIESFNQIPRCKQRLEIGILRWIG